MHGPRDRHNVFFILVLFCRIHRVITRIMYEICILERKNVFTIMSEPYFAIKNGVITPKLSERKEDEEFYF